jgi:MFS transporter, ACS family, allantoate permease
MDDKHVVDIEDHDHRNPSPITPEKQQSLPVANKAAQKVLEHSRDADEAMKAFESGEIIEIDEATNKRLLRIIDWHLLPLMCVVYGLNYLDKTTLSYASIMGLKEDIHLVGDNYQWLG